MKYYRVHTADIAWITRQPRGLFTAIGKLVDAKTLTEEEEKEYWKNREYFEKELPVPPFYDQEILIRRSLGLRTRRRETEFSAR